jgi:S1-C subfamily serine protease
MNRNAFVRVPASALRATLVFLVAFLPGQIDPTAVGAVAEGDLRRDAVVRAVESVIPCVVNISTETVVESSDPLDKLFGNFFGPYYQRRPPDAQKSLGSGVIIDETGYLVTNYHVVRRATRITVTLADGREREAKLMNATTQSDVALLKIVPKGNEVFKPVKFAGDDDLLLGETVVALGNPFGLGISVSRGILSSRSRRPPMDGLPLEIEDWLQTDAAINPGNSGGPLVNVRGELIGLNVAVFRDGQGIGFAIPIKRVSEALSEIFTPEGIRSLWLGAKFRSGTSGITVTTVQPGSPAEKAGLRRGDRVISVNETTPRNTVELARQIVEAGTRKFDFAIQRGAERKRLPIELVSEKEFFTPDLIRQKLGAEVRPLDESLGSEIGLERLEALVITRVETDSPATRAELKRGYIIRAIDGQVPRDLVQAAKLVYGKKRGERVSLSLLIPRARGRLIQLYQGTTEVVVR